MRNCQNKFHFISIIVLREYEDRDIKASNELRVLEEDL